MFDEPSRKNGIIIRIIVSVLLVIVLTVLSIFLISGPEHTKELIQEVVELVEEPVVTPALPATQATPAPAPELLTPQQELIQKFEIPQNATAEDLIKALSLLKNVSKDDDPRLDVINAYNLLAITPNTQGTTIASPLFEAVSLNMQAPILKRMHSLSPIKFDSLDKDGLTIMHAAVKRRSDTLVNAKKLKETLTFLTSIGGDINAIDSQKRSPLMLAIQEQNVLAVRLLLNDFAASPNAPVRPFTLNPLMIAAKDQNLQIFQLLQSKQADPLEENEQGISAYQYLASQGAVEGLRSLFCFTPTLKVDVQSTDGNTALHHAALNGRIDAVYYLLFFKDAKFDIKNGAGMTARAYASKYPEMDKYFSQHGLEKIKAQRYQAYLTLNMQTDEKGLKRSMTFEQLKAKLEQDRQKEAADEQALREAVRDGKEPQSKLDTFLAEAEQKRKQLEDDISNAFHFIVTAGRYIK